MAQYREIEVSKDGRKAKMITATVRIPATFAGPVAARSVSQTFNSKPMAREWARKTADAIKAGDWRDPRLQEAPALPAPTLAQVLAKYVFEVTPTKKGAAQEKTLIERLKQTAMAQRPIDQITKSDIASYRDMRLAAGRAATTIHNEVNTLSAVFASAVHDWSYCQHNPVADLKAGRKRRALPKRAAGRDRRLGAEEEAAMRVALAAGADGAEMIALLDVALATGARLGEILDDFSRAWRDGDTMRLPDTKNGSARTVVLSKAACNALDALPKRKDGKDGRYFGLDTHAVEYRWQTARGKAIKAMVKAAVEAGRDPAPIRARSNVRFHDLRHEALSRMVAACGGNLKILMMQSGHKNVAMLMRYINPTVDDVRRMVAALDAPADAEQESEQAA